MDFQRQIRPLLADKCFACHGRDAEHREGSLRLDERDSALKGGDTGEPAIAPGTPEKSELVRRIFSTDADERMPPPKSKKELTAAEKELIRRWVAEGAEYKAHWAFVAPVKPPVPKVVGTLRVPLPDDGTRSVPATDWPKNDIDRFILARLEKEGLHPSPPADEATLLRRLALDLKGLPPTLGEIDSFLKEKNYKAAIERLLNSPH